VPDDAERRSGLAYGVGAYLLWGAFPLFWPLLEPAGAIEILAHRMAWSLVVVLAALACTGGLRAFRGVRAILRRRAQRSWLTLAAALITVNWGVYIWAVNNGHVIEASLGYFINPLVTILLGVFVLGERLRRVQWIAVGIGAAAVIVIGIDYGKLPWIALTLAFSFGLYGFCKKKASAGAVDSLAVETGVLFLPALATLFVIAARGDLVFAHHSVTTSALLASSGLVTAAPLLLFAAAARRLPLSLLGLIQYLNPVLQFAVGVGIRHEPLPTAELIGFALVWVALIVLTVDGLYHQRRSRAPADAGDTRTSIAT
jgi:chloramphenicol-sensitive protein RarD